MTKAEKKFQPNFDFSDAVEEERANSWRYEGKTVFGDAQKPKNEGGIQLSLF